jgi:hypothetical protein
LSSIGSSPVELEGGFEKELAKHLLGVALRTKHDILDPVYEV